ncbi:MAG: hypothetical protein WAU70_14885 [Flavobacteriales bacterium]
MNIAFKNLLIIAAMLPLAVNAQEERSERTDRHERTMMRTEEMTKELGLNDEQAAKLKAMNDRFAEEMRSMQPTEAERQAKREKMKDLQTRRDTELKALLTEDQYARLMELRQQRRDAHEADGERRHRSKE